MFFITDINPNSYGDNHKFIYKIRYLKLSLVNYNDFHCIAISSVKI